MKKLTIAASLLGLAVGFSACDNYDDRYPEKYASVLKFAQSGEIDVPVYSTEDVQAYNFTINKGGWAPEREATVNVSVMAADAFEAYKEEMGFGYLRMLPADCYYIGTPGQTSTNISLESNTPYTYGQIQLVPAKVAEYFENLSDDVKASASIKHVIPMVLAANDNNGSRVHQDYQYMMLMPAYTDPTVQLGFSGLHHTTMAVSAKNGIAEYTIPVQLPAEVKNRWDMKFTIDTSEEALEALCAKAGASYAMIAPEAIVASNFTIGDQLAYDFVKDAYVTDLTVKIDRSVLPFSQVALPISLTAIEGAPETVKLGSKLWALIGFSVNLITGYSTNDQEASEGPLANAFDGDPKTYFHSTWSGNANHDPEYGVYIDINFADKLQKFTYTFTSRNVANINGVPKLVKLYGSTDGENWEYIGEVEDMTTVITGGSMTATFGPFEAETPFNMLRFSALTSPKGSLTEANGNFICVGELVIAPAE